MPMMIFDPVYLLVAVVSIALSALSSMWIKAAFAKYRAIPNRRHLTGAQAVRQMLAREGLGDIAIERVEGTLSDHYDPRGHVIRLSSDIHDGTSIASVSVACHEAGHALQHAQGYAPMKLRSLAVPLASFGGNLGPTLCGLGLFMGAVTTNDAGQTVAGPGMWLLKAGIVLFACAVFFTVVTLPVELDASRRAKRAMLDDGIVDDGEEAAGAARMLRAAAFTYVAAVATSVLMLLYFLFRAGLLGGRRND